MLLQPSRPGEIDTASGAPLVAREAISGLIMPRVIASLAACAHASVGHRIAFTSSQWYFMPCLSATNFRSRHGHPGLAARQPKTNSQSDPHGHPMKL